MPLQAAAKLAFAKLKKETEGRRFALCLPLPSLPLSLYLSSSAWSTSLLLIHHHFLGCKSQEQVVGGFNSVAPAGWFCLACLSGTDRGCSRTSWRRGGFPLLGLSHVENSLCSVHKHCAPLRRMTGQYGVISINSDAAMKSARSIVRQM